jgi:hypothetical protein
VACAAPWDDQQAAPEYLDALTAVRECLDIPHAATAGDEEKRTAILLERVGHTVVMLNSILHDEHPAPDIAWSVAYLRDRLAEHPPTGYRTWSERMAELDAAKDGGVFGEVIQSYSRAQAIEDGILVDVTSTANEAGFKVPVALTRAVSEDCVAWEETDTRRHGVPQDESGRLWDVLWLASLATRKARSGDIQALVELLRVPRHGRGRLPSRVTLVAEIGPGDEGEPVITILWPGED